jgi:5-methylcytosine-specific restriction endonuclease McrA
MVGIMLRELECTHCGGTFTDMEGDMIFPIPRLCDNCLVDLWHSSDEEINQKNVSAENLQLLQQLRQTTQLELLLSERDNNRENSE